MKYIIVLIALTISAQCYTEVQKRDMKHLALEGRAAKEAAKSYEKKIEEIIKNISYIETKLEAVESKLKTLQAKARCRSESCKHISKIKGCYKYRRSLLTYRSEIEKYEGMLEKREKDKVTNQKFMEAKSKLYKECVEKYKRIKGNEIKRSN